MRTTHPLPLLLSGTIVAGFLLAGCAPQSASLIDESAASAERAGSPAMEATMSQPEHILLPSADMQWQDAPPVLPAGAEVTALEGDPSKPGPFTLRLRFPADYRIPPHFHPADEHVTVISGTFALGMGDAFDEAKLTELGPGGFAMMRTGTRHFALSRDGAVIQLHGTGPWGLTYVNPADDPRGGAQ
jgi:quercetin dioxygenase-like cupin family protein